MVLRRLVPVVALACLVVGTVATPARASASTKLARGEVDRVLIISLPSVGWPAVNEEDTPHLWRLFQGAAIGNLTARTVGRSDLVAGYLTLGAGTRATAARSPVDGAGMQTDEPWGAVTARDAFRLDTGRDVASGLLAMAVEITATANAETDIGPPVGALGDALAGEGWARAVIANGDGSYPDQVPALRRSAVGALMGADGVVPGGRVDTGLLERADRAPFGLRLAPDAVTAAFEQVWQRGEVVLVEASDLVRADEFRDLAAEGQGRELARRALRDSDALVGRLLERVDLDRDAVVVVNPQRSSASALGVAAVHAPGVPPGLLSSASTRRTGFVLLADVAPTVLGIVGAPKDRDMSGSRARVGDPQPLTARIDRLVDAHETAVFRDDVRVPATLVYAALVVVVLGAGALVLARGGGRGARTAVTVGALALVYYPVSVFAARLVAFHDVGITAYWVFVLGLAAALTAGTRALTRARAADGLLLAFACVVVLLVFDVVTGARLQLASAFGYTPTIGVRVSGFGNIAYALLGTAAIFLAALLARWFGPRRGRVAAVTVLVIALLADVAPFWGSDVGGIVSLVPAFGATVAVLSGFRVRVSWRAVIGTAVVTVLALAAVTAVDLARPAESRTHLGRLAQGVFDDGLEPALDSLGRKVDSNLTTWTTSEWRITLAAAVVFLLYLAFAQRDRVRGLVDAVPECRAALVGCGVLGVLGYAFNDSGVVVPAIVGSLTSAALLVLLLTVAPVEPGESSLDRRVVARSSGPG